MSPTTHGIGLYEITGAVDGIGKIYDQWAPFPKSIRGVMTSAHIVPNSRDETYVMVNDAHSDPVVEHMSASALFAIVSLQKVARTVQSHVESFFTKPIPIEVHDQGDVVFAYGDEFILEYMLSRVIYNTFCISTHEIDKVKFLIHRIERSLDEKLVPGSVSSGAYVGVTVSINVRNIRFDMLQEIVVACMTEEYHLRTASGHLIAEFFMGSHSGALVASIDPGNGFRFTAYLHGYTTTPQ